MNRQSFLWELRCCLTGRMSAQEVEQVIAYYTEYFQEAGDDREQAVIDELGHPRDVASRILGQEIPPDAVPEEEYPDGAFLYRRRSPHRTWIIAGAIVLALVCLPISSYLGWNVLVGLSNGERRVGRTSNAVTVVEDVGAVTTVGPYAATQVTSGGTDDTVLIPLDNLTALDINVSVAEIEIRPGDEAKVELFVNWDDYRLTYEYDGECLSVRDEGEPFGLFAMNGKKAAGQVVLTIPTGWVLDRVDVNTDMGSVTAQFDAYAAYLSSDLGSITLAQCTADELTVSVSAGEIQLNGGEFQRLELSNKAGQIAAKDFISHGLTIVNELGNIDVSGTLYGENDVIQALGNASISTTLPKDEYGYELTTDLGRVAVDGKGMGNHVQMDGEPNYIYAESSLGAISIAFGR